jgi:hypothetical protein
VAAKGSGRIWRGDCGQKGERTDLESRLQLEMALAGFGTAIVAGDSSRRIWRCDCNRKGRHTDLAAPDQGGLNGTTDASQKHSPLEAKPRTALNRAAHKNGRSLPCGL